MVVFKFVIGLTFTDVVAAGNTDRWTEFYGAGDDTAKVQTEIQQYLDKAKQGNADLYAAFNAIVDDPNWTGMLVFNCPLNGQELPSDLQILLGGIDEALRAHHFGVTINRLTDQATDGTTNASFQIADSSLFAVIDYDQALGPVESAPNLQVLLLNVQFANSKLVVFRSTIAFSIDAMFGNTLQLTVAPDGDQKANGTIVIDGAYTVHPDGTGSLVFVTDETRVFAVPDGDTKTRVVQAARVDDATLVPISSTTSDGETLATAAFRVDMRMVLEAGVAGDLFSYGEYEDGGSGNTRVPSTGLDVVDYAFPMTTTIPTQGQATLAYQADDLSALKVDQVTSTSRATTASARCSRTRSTRWSTSPMA